MFFVPTIVLIVVLVGLPKYGFCAQDNFNQTNLTDREIQNIISKFSITSHEESPAKIIDLNSSRDSKALDEFGNPVRNITFPWANLSPDLDTWEAPLEIRRNYPYYLSGYDDEGRPIWVGEIGKWNFRRVVEAGDQTLRDFDKYFEQAAYRSVKALGDRSTPDSPVNDAIMIADFEEFDIVQAAHVPTVTHLLGISRKYRQVIAKHLHVGIGLNTNAVAATLVNAIRPIFGSIFERAEIYGTNRQRWIPRVLKYCPRDQIPEWYGGTKNFRPVQVYG